MLVRIRFIFVSERNGIGPSLSFELVVVILASDIVLIYLPFKTTIVLHDDKKCREQAKQLTCLSIDAFVSSVDHEEDHISKVLKVVDRG